MSTPEKGRSAVGTVLLHLRAESGKPDESPVDAAAATARLKAILPELNAAIASGRSDADDLRRRGVAAGAAAKAKDFAGVNRLVDEIEAALRAKPGSGSPPPDEIPKGIVAQRQFLVTRWQQLPGQVAPELDRFISGIEAEFPGIENLDKFRAAIEQNLRAFYDEIQDEIDRAINAGDMGRLAGLKERILGHELVGRLANNSFSEGSRFRSLLVAALAEVEAALTA